MLMDWEELALAATFVGAGYWVGGQPGAIAGGGLLGVFAVIHAVRQWFSSLRTQLDLHGMALDRIQEQLVEVQDRLEELKNVGESVQWKVEHAASDVTWLCKQVRNRSDLDD